jgi:sulfate adenylyltransferase
MEYILNQRQICDLEMILNGVFFPLEGFMNFRDYSNVLENCRLQNGSIFPIPITLAISKIKIDKEVKEIILLDKFKNHIAKLKVEDIYEPDIEYECLKIFETIDTIHPYVEYLFSLGDVYYIGGKVEKINSIIHTDFLEYREDKVFKKDQNILGIHTSSCFAHKTVLKEVGKINNICLFLLLEKNNNINQLFVNSALKFVQKCKEKNIKAKICLLNLSKRMAGKKEALWYSIIQKNYGCNHFIVNYTSFGPNKKFYNIYEIYSFLMKFSEELGVIFIKSNKLGKAEKLNKRPYYDYDKNKIYINFVKNFGKKR